MGKKAESFVTPPMKTNGLVRPVRRGGIEIERVHFPRKGVYPSPHGGNGLVGPSSPHVEWIGPFVEGEGGEKGLVPLPSRGYNG